MTLFGLERWCCFTIVIPLPNKYRTPSPTPHIPTQKKTHLAIITHRSRLGLRDQVPPQHGGLDGALLDGGRLLETVRVDSAQQLLGDLHAIERVDGLIPVGVDVGIGEAPRGGLPSVVCWLFTVGAESWARWHW